jgi:TatD DNase family protein
MRRLIDSHVHIEGFSDPRSIMSESIELGVDAVVCVGGDIRSSVKALEVSERFPKFYFPAIGVHPSKFLNEDLASAETFIRENLSKCIAMGEVGLDYAYDFAKPKEVRAKMKDYFEKLLNIATEFNIPVSVHSRSAYQDTLNLVTASNVDAVFHWYDGPTHTLNKLIDSGYYVSATPAIEYSKGVKAIMHEAPLEKILVETDSPIYLRNLHRKSRPIDVIKVVNKLAELKDLDPSEVIRTTTRNTEKLFRI